MTRRLAIGSLALFLVVGCADPAPTTSPVVDPTAAATPAVTPAAASPVPASGDPATAKELPAGGSPLAAGTYQRTGFLPPVTFAVDDGWSTGTVSDGFFDVQQESGTPDVIAVQFARVLGVVGADGAKVPATHRPPRPPRRSRANPGLSVIESDASRLGGLEGRTIVVENTGTRTAPVLDVSLGTLGFDPGRRLWISLFDTDARAPRRARRRVGGALGRDAATGRAGPRVGRDRCPWQAARRSRRPSTGPDRRSAVTARSASTSMATAPGSCSPTAARWSRSTSRRSRSPGRSRSARAGCR